MMRFKMLALVAATMFTLPALADKPSPDSTKPAKEKKICRREPVTGSIIPYKTTCHTQSDWEAIDATNARSVESMANNRPSGTQRP